MHLPLFFSLALLALVLFSFPFWHLLRPRHRARRLVILSLSSGYPDVELLLRYELARARAEQNTTLFLCNCCAGEEEQAIVARFAKDEPNLIYGDLTRLQEQLLNQEVYKLVEVVLY